MKPAVAVAPAVCVPKLWEHGTVACLATGPSLTQADVDYVRGKVSGVIAINDAYRLAPWADVLYACDEKWLTWHWNDVSKFQGLKYSLNPRSARFPGVTVLRNSGSDGLEMEPSGLKTGSNSGFQAVNLAVHFGATRVLLLGYDMQGDHFFGKHPDGTVPPFQICLEKFKTLVEPLKRLGVDVINCTRVTKLDCFPQMAIEDAL